MLMLLLGTGCEAPYSLHKDSKISFYEPGVVRETRGRVVLVGGCFDVLHYGHLKFLKAAKAIGDKLIVALEPDTSIQIYKKRSPIHTAGQRAEILASLSFVDEVMILPSMQGDRAYLQLVQDVHPAFIAVTAGDPQLANKQKQAALVGAQVTVVTALLAEFSTTCIRAGSCYKRGASEEDVYQLALDPKEK